MIETIESLNSQAIKLASLGEYKQAIECFRKAISMEKTNHLLWFNLGLTYRDSGDLEQAKKSLQIALRLNPDNIEILDCLAIISNNLKQTTEALEFCQQALAIDNENFRIWNTIGVIFFNKGKYENACEAFEQAVTINPYYYDALFNLRDTYDELGNEAGKQECIFKMKSLEKKG